MGADSAVMFAGPAADDIRFEPLGLLTACYHRPSGRTHLLTEPAPEILALIADHALSAQAMLAALGQQYDFSDEDGDIAEALESRLAELVEAGLIVQVEAPEQHDA